MGKRLLGIVLLLSCASFAQTTKKQPTSPEYLEVSVIDNNCGNPSYSCRHYFYFNSGIRQNGPLSLNWLNKAGWELTSTVSSDGSLNGLLFKRNFNQDRTEKEIEWLPAELGREIQEKGVKPLIDLDTADAKQNLAGLTQAEKAKLRTALEQIKDLPLKIIGVSSELINTRETGIGAEIVIDGTSVLLKDDNNYRSSAADKYFKEISKHILERIGAAAATWSEGNAVAISGGGFKPRIGNFLIVRHGITLKISIIVNYRNQEIIVAQGWIYSQWKSNPQ